MKRFNIKIINIVFVAFTSLLLSACSGLSDGVVQQIEQIPNQIKQHEAFIADKKAAFDNLDSHQEWDFFNPYLKKEQWSDKLAEATKLFSVAKSTYENDIVDILDRDDPEEDTAARVLIKEFEYQLNQSKNSALYIEQRIAFLINVRDTSSAINNKSKQGLDRLLSLESELIVRANKSAVDYAHKKDDIAKKVHVLTAMVEKGRLSRAKVSEQFNKDKQNIDYAVLGDEAVSLSQTLIESIDYKNKIDSKFDELYRSYTKILADQKINYFIVIGRASWCEGEYCGNGRTKHYPAVLVDQKVFEYFDGLKVDVIAQLSSSWGRQRFNINVTKAAWEALRIDKGWNWSRGDDHAEYWIEKTYTKTYHRYTEVVNDRMSKGDWVAVKEDDFWNQYSHLGMAVLTKPYGYYEEDALKDAQPVGMATMAKPTVVNGVATGRNQYGEWRQQNGNSFWHYYGMYSMFRLLTGPSPYYYNDWRGYSNRGRGQSYFGRRNEYGTWGSSTYNNTRYSNSSFASRNPGEVRSARSGKSRNFSRTSSSIRGAGSSSRGRGPSGSGK